MESFSIGEERRTKKGGKGRKRGGKEDKKGDKKEEKILKYKIWWAKKNKKQNKMILPFRFGEAFLNRTWEGLQNRWNNIHPCIIDQILFFLFLPESLVLYPLS